MVPTAVMLLALVYLQQGVPVMQHILAGVIMAIGGVLLLMNVSRLARGVPRADFDWDRCRWYAYRVAVAAVLASIALSFLRAPMGITFGMTLALPALLQAWLARTEARKYRMETEAPGEQA